MASFGRGLGLMLMAIVVVGFVLVFIGGYWVLKDDDAPPPQKGLPRMANLPPRSEDTPPPPSYPSDAPVLEQVRKALRDGITPAEAVVMATTLPDRPERADAAFLLLEYAAESGNAEAALAVGGFYDPAYEGPSGSIRKNPMTAYDWYTKALANGQENARTRLAQLRSWAEAKATQGSSEAQEMLNNWR